MKKTLLISLVICPLILGGCSKKEPEIAEIKTEGQNNEVDSIQTDLKDDEERLETIVSETNKIKQNASKNIAKRSNEKTTKDIYKNKSSNMFRIKDFNISVFNLSNYTEQQVLDGLNYDKETEKVVELSLNYVLKRDDFVISQGTLPDRKGFKLLHGNDVFSTADCQTYIDVQPDDVSGYTKDKPKRIKFIFIVPKEYKEFDVMYSSNALGEKASESIKGIKVNK